MTYYNDVLNRLGEIGANTSNTEINVSSIVINTSAIIVNTQDIEVELQQNRTGIYLTKSVNESINANVSWIPTTYPNLSYINANTSSINLNLSSFPSISDNLSYINSNTSASLVEVTSIDDNISYGFRFSGGVYHNFIEGSNNVSRFESSKTLLRDFVITCTVQDVVLGDENNRSFVLPTGATWGGALLDASSLYFKNASLNQTTNIAILATRE